MKTAIHPKYYPEARVVCSCGNTWTTGSTQKAIRTDVCSKCHPFFTGEQRIVDSAGQVDRFMKRLDRYSTHQAQAVERQQLSKKKLEQKFLKQQLGALDLTGRVHEILDNASIVSIGDLAQKLEKDKASLMALEGFGPKSLEEVESKLAEPRETYFAEATK
jgi:large subunit ribosomal protein L31